MSALAASGPLPLIAGGADCQNGAALDHGKAMLRQLTGSIWFGSSS